MTNSDERPLVQIGLPRDLVVQIDHIRAELQITKSATYERILRYALALLQDNPTGKLEAFEHLNRTLVLTEPED